MWYTQGKSCIARDCNGRRQTAGMSRHVAGPPHLPANHIVYHQASQTGQAPQRSAQVTAR